MKCSSSWLSDIIVAMTATSSAGSLDGYCIVSFVVRRPGVGTYCIRNANDLLAHSSRQRFPSLSAIPLLFVVVLVCEPGQYVSIAQNGGYNVQLWEEIRTIISSLPTASRLWWIAPSVSITTSAIPPSTIIRHVVPVLVSTVSSSFDFPAPLMRDEISVGSGIGAFKATGRATGDDEVALRVQWSRVRSDLRDKSQVSQFLDGASWTLGRVTVIGLFSKELRARTGAPGPLLPPYC